MQSLEHSLQGHFPSGHCKLKGHILQLLLRQAVHTGHFPVAELLACGGRACRCNDGVALFGCRCGAAIDGKGAAFNGNAVEFLVLCLYLHVFTLHGKGRGLALGIGQLHASLVDHPAVKHVARAAVSLNGDFSTLFCLRQGCGALEHCNCMELCILRVQGNIAFRHLEGDPVLVDLIAQINAGRCPVFKDVTFFVRCPSFDRLPRTCLSSFRVIHLDDNSSIVGVDGVVHFRRNVHSIFVYVDGLTTRVDRRAVLSIRVDVLAAGIDDAACHAARAIVLDDDSGRARDRNIAPHDVVTIPLTRDCYRGGPFHRHIAVHGGASSRSNFHLAVTADLNIAEDGNIGLGRDLDVLCICDRQFAAYSCFT